MVFCGSESAKLGQIRYLKVGVGRVMGGVDGALPSRGLKLVLFLDFLDE